VENIWIYWGDTEDYPLLEEQTLAGFVLSENILRIMK
jgi:hypothetical protein